MVPTLDLQGLKYEEVENEVKRFLSLWMGKHLFTYFKVAEDQGLECKTGMPGYPGKVRVVML